MEAQQSNQSSAALSETHSQLQRLQSQTTHLQTSLNKLSSLLSARTGSNTRITAAHTSLSKQLSELVSSGDLSQLHRGQSQLLDQMQQVSEHFDTLNALAHAVGDVKTTLLELETRTASRLARARARAAANK